MLAPHSWSYQICVGRYEKISCFIMENPSIMLSPTSSLVHKSLSGKHLKVNLATQNNANTIKNKISLLLIFKGALS